jgi:hypothetical protein
VVSSWASPTLLGPECIVQRSKMPRPDVQGVTPERGQGIGLVGEKFGQPPVALAQIAGGAGGHYVAARLVAAAHLWLDVIDGQCRRRELLSAVHAAPLVSGKDLFALHDG